MSSCDHVIMHIEYASRDGVYQKMAIQYKYTEWSAWLTFFVSAHFFRARSQVSCALFRSNKDHKWALLFFYTMQCEHVLLTQYHATSSSNCHFSTLTSKITCIFNSQLPHINNSNVTHTYSTIWPTYVHHSAAWAAWVSDNAHLIHTAFSEQI